MIIYGKNNKINTDSKYLRTCPLLGDWKINNAENAFIYPLPHSIVTISKVNIVHIISNKVRDNNSNIEPDISPQIQIPQHLNIHNTISNNPHYFPKQDDNIQRLRSNSNYSVDNTP